MGSIADIAAALAVIPDPELRAVRATLDAESVIVPALLTWLEEATRWEIDRRAGCCDELLDPRIAIGQSDVECSLVVLAILHAPYRNVAGVADFLDATAEVLCTRAVESPHGVH